MGAIPNDPKTTILPLPKELRERVMAQAVIDNRSLKGQLIALVLEAMDARDRKAKR